ncbi:aldehyde dehydrogenase family protein [Rhodococcus sp. IEGM 1366]|uniref:aldehyde dehydrogenase family protein n=1 Tax=Rhodococcus sp. IEGM 1366 TaxID=3082223 RepID=UPI0029545E0D|nr:aldehyde dehydrogenase family protein [Rhodococcus sp. IEGM 1366]MDV8070652.1 aldehyde dehydrogenase family protein [Rhodococcus sp. IEGM 1366]
MIRPDHLMLIDGNLVTATTDRVFENINPANEEVIGHAPDANAGDIERAILAARKAFDTTSWSTDHAFRRECLIQLQQGLQKEVESIRPMLVAEVGTPVMTTYGIQLDECIGYISHYVDLLESYQWDRMVPPPGSEEPQSHRVVCREAVGVVVAITPWNVPLYLNIAKTAAALAAGCTVVLKPAPDTAFSALVLGEIAHKYTDIPAGVFNVVTTSDNSVASVLTSHPAVDAISLTGSTATGRKIMAAAAPTLKKITLELGGKSPAILLDDADFEKIAPVLAAGTCFHAGQGCAIYTRALVSEKRKDELVERIAGIMGMIPWGDPTDPANIMGPVANARQHESVLRYYEIANETSRVILGGQRTDRFEKGYWVEPTLITDVDPMSTIPQEEVFGPLLTVLTYKDEEDAIAIANNTIFGLAGAVYSDDAEHALSLARRLRSGSIGINGAAAFHSSVPFGGYKQSGLGREWGTEGLEDFLEVKTIAYPTLAKK